MEQCRDKIKKLKSEHKKLEIRGRPQDKGDIQSGNFSMHWTKFLVIVIESFHDSQSVLNTGIDDDTQDMSGGIAPEGTPPTK